MRILGVLALLACVLARPGWAQSIQVAPVSLNFAAGQLVTTLTVTNRGADPIVVQLRPFAWRQADAEQQLSPTTDLAISPPFAQVPPGQSQLVRLLLRAPPGVAETTYRLVIDEIPPPAVASAIRVALRMSLPVFAAPAARVAPALTWRIAVGAGGSFLEAANAGTSHARVLAASLVADGRNPVEIRTAVQPYVLAGSAARWRIAEAAGLRPGATGRLRMNTDTGPLEVAAPIVSAAR